MIILPLSLGEIKLSCFSAVMPVIGWNQCVKCVAPFSIAQSFIAFATISAVSPSSRSPSFIERWTCLYACFGSRACMTQSLNTIEPNNSITFFISRSAFRALGYNIALIEELYYPMLIFVNAYM